MSVSELDVSLETLQKFTLTAIKKELERKRVEDELKQSIEKQTAHWITNVLPHIKQQIAAAATRGACSMILFHVPAYITISMLESYFPGLTIIEEDLDSFMKTYRARIRWCEDPSKSPASKWEAIFIDPYDEPEEVGGRSELFGDDDDW